MTLYLCNDEIENRLRLDSLRAKNEINILFLEAGGSDQSTLLRQMKLLYHNGYSAWERDAWKEIFFFNVTQAMRCVAVRLYLLFIISILSAVSAAPSSRRCRTSDIQLAPNNATCRAIILFLPTQIDADVLPPDIAGAVRGLWRGTSAGPPTPSSHKSQLLARRLRCY